MKPGGVRGPHPPSTLQSKLLVLMEPPAPSTLRLNSASGVAALWCSPGGPVHFSSGLISNSLYILEKGRGSITRTWVHPVAPPTHPRQFPPRAQPRPVDASKQAGWGHLWSGDGGEKGSRDGQTATRPSCGSNPWYLALWGAKHSRDTAHIPLIAPVRCHSSI